jgi:hypothetical protein
MGVPWFSVKRLRNVREMLPGLFSVHCGPFGFNSSLLHVLILSRDQLIVLEILA